MNACKKVKQYFIVPQSCFGIFLCMFSSSLAKLYFLLTCGPYTFLNLTQRDWDQVTQRSHKLLDSCQKPQLQMISPDFNYLCGEFDLPLQSPQGTAFFAGLAMKSQSPLVPLVLVDL
jgi:hypothetical protein